jgi:hypothetical protein
MSRLQDITTFTDTEINDLDYFWVNEIETSTATLSIASPCVVTKNSHGLEVGNKISFTTTGALPTGLVASTDYFIISSGFGANSFKLSATFGGTAINTSGTQSGVHTYTAYVSKKMTGEKIKTLVVPSTPASEVAFDKLTPTTAGVVFTPNTPATTNILYYSTVDGSTWIYNGTIYKSKAIPNSTEFNIDGVFVDAGSNKTSTISRNGNLKIRENNTLLSKFTEILSYGVSIVSDTFAQISQTAVSTTVYPLTRMTRKRGTITSQTNALSGDTLGVMAWNGGSANDSAQIFAQATENNAGTLGASLYFQTVQTGSSGLSTAFWIDGTAKLNISLGSVYTYATANTLSGFDASKNLVSLSTATYPSLTELSYVKGLTGPVGTLATQSGTFSGTSSGTNTGDQIISDATITTTDITTNNVSITKHGFAPKAPNNTTQFLRGDGTWATPSAGGLTYFTEAQSTASPNDLVNVDSLTAVASTTNADFVIQPKGNGAILCSIPNNTAIVPNIGGNKRGQYALDLQRFGTSNVQTEVASGNYSAIIGGYRNTASGTNDSVVNGFRNTVSGGYSTILNGQLNTASGLYSFIGVGQSNTASSTYAMVIGGFGNNSTGGYAISGGGSCTASGTRGVALGDSNTASGAYSASLNSTNTASSDYSNARGLSANTGTTWGKWAIGGGGATLGSSQKGLLVQTTRTTGNTPTEIAFQGGGVDARAQMTCADNMGMRVKGSVIGKQSGSVNISAWDFDYVIVRGVGVGTTSVVVSNVNVVTNVPAWGTPTITADTARGYASLKVIGAAATNIQWTATIESTEVIYA